MSPEEKKAYLLLKAVIFHYHGLDEDEQEMLEETAESLGAQEELTWAQEFIKEDYYTAFERSRKWLGEVMIKFDPETRLSHLSMVWNANNKKGYISEMEATAMLKLAKDWEIESDLINMIKK